MKKEARTKIVATLGPASSSRESIKALLQAGADVFRINMAHGSREDHDHSVRTIREIERELGRPVGILADLAGPKIRLGTLLEDPTVCVQGDRFEFVRGTAPGHPRQLTSNYAQLVDDLAVDDQVVLADGAVAMRVLEVTADKAVCEVTAGGELRNRQGINLPGVNVSLPAITEKDLRDAEWAVASEVDFVGLSFVRTPAEVRRLKQLLRERGSHALTIAKIEKREALDALDEIVAVADGVMVARGDLGVEIDVAETPIWQKQIISVCRRLYKPVIVATQMLDSMQESKRPTRAEASDVANAILDGADACMLSGETAVGKYPVVTVETMNRIMLATEEILEDSPLTPLPVDTAGVHPITSAVVYGSGRIASRLGAKLVVVVTQSGATARVKAKQRELVPTVAVSRDAKTLRQCTLFWGIMPLSDCPDHGPELRAFISRWAVANEFAQIGDCVVFVMGNHVVPVAHNLLAVHQIEGHEPQAVDPIAGT